MRRIAHKMPLFSLTIIVHVLGGVLFFNLMDPLLPTARNASDTTQHSAFPGSWTDLLGSWEAVPVGSSENTGVTFTAAYKLVIQTTCATFRGGYLSIVPGHLTVAHLDVAETRCAFDAEAAEPLLNALKNATGYIVYRHNRLQIISEAGVAFTFRRAFAPEPAEAAL